MGLLIPFLETAYWTTSWQGEHRGREMSEVWIQIFQGRGQLAWSQVCKNPVLGLRINTQSCMSQAEDGAKWNRIKIESNTRPQLLTVFSVFLFTVIYWFLCMGINHMIHVWGPEDNLWKLILSFHHVSLKGWTQVPSNFLIGKYFHFFS